MDGGLALADRARWAQEQFGAAELEDVRRTRRLVQVATLMAGNSSASIPQQMDGVASTKAAYRLFATEAVTHEAVCAQHWQHTRSMAGALPMAFLVSDICTLSYVGHIQTQGLGPIHDAKDLGLHQLNVLAVDPATQRPIGLAWQNHFKRELIPAGETRTRRRQRPLSERESYIWNRGIQAVGTPSNGSIWVHVIDRGGDEFKVYDETRQTGTEFIIRAAQNRCIEPTAEGHRYLFDAARALSQRAERTVRVRTRDGSMRQAKLRLGALQVMLKPPAKEPELRTRPALSCWVLRAWEPQPPPKQAPLEWILLTSLDLEHAHSLEAVVNGYALRWMIEEFHKSQKTGCQVEARRLQDADRLEPLIGVLSILAVYLLQLKYVARTTPELPARELLDEEPIAVMAAYLKRSPTGMTVGQFWRGIGRLGGHLGRANDGPVGWLRAWRGWQAFQLILLGASLANAQQVKKCG